MSSCHVQLPCPVAHFHDAFFSVWPLLLRMLRLGMGKWAQGRLQELAWNGQQYVCILSPSHRPRSLVKGHMLPFCRIHIPHPPPACRDWHCSGIASLSSAPTASGHYAYLASQGTASSIGGFAHLKETGEARVCQLSGHRSRGHTASLHTLNNSLSQPKPMHNTLPLDAVNAVSSQRCPSAEIRHLAGTASRIDSSTSP